MASGDVVVRIVRAIPPGANAATPDIRAGGSTPTEQVAVWDFDGTTNEFMDFECELIGYGGGGLTFTGKYLMTSATTGVVKWEAALRRFEDDAENLGSSHSYDFNSAAEDTVPNVSGEPGYFSVTFTNGSDMDSVATGEKFILRIRRNNTTSGTNATGDAELWGPLVGRET